MLNLSIESVSQLIQDVADEHILPYFQKLQPDDIRFKPDGSPVTTADLNAEKALSQRLTDLVKGSHVVGEEAYAANPKIFELFDGEDPVWIIDPVDGTKAFIGGYPFFGVIVSLAVRNRTLAGWLYDPSSREFITAERGAGAWHKGQRLAVLPAAPLENMAGVLNTAYAQQLAGAIPQKERRPQLYHALSSCHDYARLVVQSAHFSRQTQPIHFIGTFHSCTPWDIAAGALIHHEAGGYTAHWEEDRFRPCHIDRGFLSAPDRESWKALRCWLHQYSDLPEI